MRILIPFLLALLAPAAAAQSVAVQAGKVITNDGRTIENGIIVVSGGRITALGADAEIPFDALLHEFPEATVFPGFLLAHTSSGLDRANENIPVAPFLDVRDSLDPVSFFFEDELRKGVVAIGVIPGNNCVIGGRGLVVAPFGMTVEQMTLSDDMGMKIAMGPKSNWSRSAQLAELREAQAALEDALRRKGRELLEAAAARADQERAGEEAGDEQEPGGFVRFGADFPGKELLSRSDVKDTEQALVELLNGDLRAWLWCPEATDVLHGLEWARANALLEQTTFVIQAPAWKAAALLAEAGRPVVLQCDGNYGLWHEERDPVTYEERRTFVPKVLFDAGITFAVTSREGLMGPDRLAYQAATCLREGLPRDAALAAVTTGAAAALGLDERLGRLREGADGTFVVMSGDPLDAGSQVLEVWVRGARVYSRETDERLQRLLEGETE